MAGVSVDAGRGARPWAPNQLRHPRGTEVRAQYGREAARTVLGHTTPGVTEVTAVAAVTTRADAPSSNDHSADPIDIKPMNLSGVSSVHRLTVRFGSPTAPPHDVGGWTLTPRSAAVPDSLWGKPPEKFSQIPPRPAA